MTVRVLSFAYTSNDPDCPPELRAVAHCFAQDLVSGRIELLPATQVGSEPSQCAERLAAFLEAELAGERRRAENAKAFGERVRAKAARAAAESSPLSN